MMRREVMVLALVTLATVCVADDAPVGSRPRQAAVAPPAASVTAADEAANAADAPAFITEAKWLLAGYSNNEVVYTIIVTNRDPRIIRCTTEVKGTYVENGQKMSISDRQITTVFPNQPTQVGNWMDLDEQAGATYSVKCHRV